LAPGCTNVAGTLPDRDTLALLVHYQARARVHRRHRWTCAGTGRSRGVRRPGRAHRGREPGRRTSRLRRFLPPSPVLAGRWRPRRRRDHMPLPREPVRRHHRRPPARPRGPRREDLLRPARGRHSSGGGLMVRGPARVEHALVHLLRRRARAHPQLLSEQGAQLVVDVHRLGSVPQGQ